MLAQLKGFLVGVANNGMKKGRYNVWVELGAIRDMPVWKVMVQDQSQLTCNNYSEEMCISGIEE